MPEHSLLMLCVLCSSWMKNKHFTTPLFPNGSQVCLSIYIYICVCACLSVLVKACSFDSDGVFDLVQCELSD